MIKANTYCNWVWNVSKYFKKNIPSSYWMWCSIFEAIDGCNTNIIITALFTVINSTFALFCLHSSKCTLLSLHLFKNLHNPKPSHNFVRKIHANCMLHLKKNSINNYITSQLYRIWLINAILCLDIFFLLLHWIESTAMNVTVVIEFLFKTIDNICNIFVDTTQSKMKP